MQVAEFSHEAQETNTLIRAKQESNDVTELRAEVKKWKDFALVVAEEHEFLKE